MTWEKIKFFVVSLWLLNILILIQTVKIPVCIGEGCYFVGTYSLLKTNIVPILCLIVLCSSAFFHYNFKYKVAGTAKGPLRVVKIEPLNYETLVFIATYVIPLAGFNFNEIRQVLVFFVLLGSIGLIYIKTNIFHTNPSLVLLGYKLYRITGEINNKIVVDGGTAIASTEIAENDSATYVSLSKNLVFIRKLSNTG